MFGFRGEPGFLNCDDVCMCVVNKQFELFFYFFRLEDFIMINRQKHYTNIYMIG